MRKAIGAVAAMLVVAGAVAAPANAVAPASVETVASPVTVAVEADAMAVLSYDSPTVATVAAPEPEPVVYVAPEPVVAPVASVPVNTGGTVTEQPSQPVETAPVTATATEPEPAPVVAPEPAAVTGTEPIPAPTPTEESEVQSPIEVTDSPEYLEGMSFILPGEVYGGSYVGDSSAWVAAGNRVVVSPTIRKADPDNPLGPTMDVFHVYATIGNAPTPEEIEAMGDPTKK